MDTKQFVSLIVLGRNILNRWLFSGSNPEDLDMNYNFEAHGDAELIERTARRLGLDPEDEEVWALVKVGYQETLTREIEGTRDELVGVNLYDRPATQEWPCPKWVDRGEKK
jgi:hypothetical protein